MYWKFVTASCAAVLVTAPAQAQQSVVAFEGVSVVPMDREQVLSGQTVVVRNGRIVDIGPVRTVKVPRNAVRIDGQGKYLMPGLADMHIHIFQEQIALPDRMNEVLLAFLKRGITTVRDMHSGFDLASPQTGERSDNLAVKVKAQVATGQVLGPHIYTAADLRVGGRQGQAVRESMLALHAAGHDFIKFNERWTRASNDSVQKLADSLGFRIAGHIPPYLGIEGVIKARWASIEHMMGYVNYLIGHTGDEAVNDFGGAPADTATWLQPAYQLDQAKLAKIAVATREADVWNCPTMSRLYWPIVGPSAIADKRVGRRYFDYDLQMIKALQDAGAGLLLGTDMGGPTTLFEGEYSLQREMELMIQAGLTPYQVLAMGTKNVARFMRIEDSSGTVAVGKWADLILLDGNPLEDVHHTTTPVGVMTMGHWLSKAEFEQRLQAFGEERQRQNAGTPSSP